MQKETFIGSTTLLSDAVTFNYSLFLSAKSMYLYAQNTGSKHLPNT